MPKILQCQAVILPCHAGDTAVSGRDTAVSSRDTAARSILDAVVSTAWGMEEPLVVPATQEKAVAGLVVIRPCTTFAP